MTSFDNPDPGWPDMSDAIARLCDLLWEERDLMLMLQFRLESQLTLLRFNETRWIKLADDDVRAAVRRVKDCEVLRAMEVQEVATSLAMSPDVTLRELAESSPEPWGAMLHDHQRALAAIADGAKHALVQTRGLIRRDDSVVQTEPGRPSGGDRV